MLGLFGSKLKAWNAGCHRGLVVQMRNEKLWLLPGSFPRSFTPKRLQSKGMGEEWWCQCLVPAGAVPQGWDVGGRDGDIN